MDCVFSGKIKKAFFNGTVPQEDQNELGRRVNDFCGNDFTNVDLIDVGFRSGIDLLKQKLPFGLEYLFLPDAISAIAYASQEVSKWQESKLQQNVVAILKALELELSEGQNQLLIRADSFSKKQREAAEKVISVLKSAP